MPGADLTHVNQALSTHVNVVGQALSKGAADSLKNELVANTPVSKGPSGGKLKRAWRVTTLGGLSYQVVNDAGYLDYVRYGHGEIVPRRAKMLRFQVWPSGEIVFAKRVRPVAPNNFVERSLETTSRNNPSSWIAKLL